MPLTPSYHDCVLPDSVKLHYVEAGHSSAPTVLLLHGFPSSSSQFRNLIPLLSDKYHVLAPDLPGFGLTSVPADYVFTFDHLATTIQTWIDTLGLTRFAIYVFDYGAPVGFRIATAQPSRITGIVTQNGNAYKEGFGEPFWRPIFKLWDSSNSEKDRESVRDNVLTLETTAFQYTAGTPQKDIALIDPHTYHTDYLQSLSSASGRQDAQLDLFYDYRKNVALYPEWQAYIRKSEVPILAVWGKGDPAFIPAGAEAFKRDSPGAEVVLLDAGHFALETKVDVVATLMLQWLDGLTF